MSNTDPRIEAVAAALYEHPAAWMRHDPDWSRCPHAARGAWRDEAARILAALDTVGINLAVTT